MKRLGLMMVLWIAKVLLNGKLNKQEEEQLERLRTSLHVNDFED